MTTQSAERRADERTRETVLPVPPAPYPYLWFSGEQTPWEQALVHVTMVGWPAVNAIFEGIRGYWNDEQQALYIFRLTEHMDRFENSMKLQRMAPRFSGEEVGRGEVELCRANRPRGDIYLQPVAFMTGGSSGARSHMDQPPEVMITMRPSESGLGS